MSALLLPLMFGTLFVGLQTAATANGRDAEGDSVGSQAIGGTTGGSYEPVLAASTYGSGRAVVAGDHNWIAEGKHSWCLYYDNLELLVNVCKWLYPYLPIDPSDPTLYPHVAIDVTRLHSYTPDFTYAIQALLDAGFYHVDVWSSGKINDPGRIPNPYYVILIICWPQSAYSSNEVTAILNHVSGGYGLLFLGEYYLEWRQYSGGIYPAAAQPIIGPLGISINANELYDPTDYETDWGPEWPKIHTFPVVHPITTGIDIYMPAATATLEVNSPAVTIATGDNDTYVISGAVGGIVVPVDKFGLLAPYIGLSSTILVATVATAIYAKRVKRRKEKQ